MASKVVVVDMQSGNLHSVAKAVQSVCSKHHQVEISNDLSIISQADKLILPGQGAIHTWMSVFNSLNEDNKLMNAIQSKPVFAICVGMQAMFKTAEEGSKDGKLIHALGIFEGYVKRFNTHDYPQLTTPQMGWNQVFQQQHKLSSTIWQYIPQDAWFYFAHSYHVINDLKENCLAQTSYGDSYTSAIANENIIAVQFHPEKSQKNGLQLIENFLNWSV